MSHSREPHPVPDLLKQPMYRVLRIAEGAVRGIAGTNPPVDPASLRGIRNFLFPQFQPALGCVVHVTPVIDAIRFAVPGARIVGAMSGIALDVFRHHPGLDVLHPVPDPVSNLRTTARELRRIIDDFRGEPYCVLMTSGTHRAAVALAAMLSGNGVRVGISTAPRLMHIPVLFDPALSQIANNLRVVQAVGHKVPSASEPRIYFSQTDLDQAQSLLFDRVSPRDTPLAIFVSQTSPGQRKGWRAERFVCVAQWLMRNYDMRIALVGTGAEAAAVEHLRTQIGGNCVSVAGRTSIPVLAALLAQSDIALSLDSGILHIARAVQLPACVIAPAWSPVHEWLPLDNPRFRILKKLDLPAAPPDYIVDEVSTADVCAALGELLHLFPPSPEGREVRIWKSLVPVACEAPSGSPAAAVHASLSHSQ